VSILIVVVGFLTYIPLLDVSAQTVSIIRTRVVSKVLLRIGMFWSARKLPDLLNRVLFSCLEARSSLGRFSISSTTEDQQWNSPSTFPYGGGLHRFFRLSWPPLSFPGTITSSTIRHREWSTQFCGPYARCWRACLLDRELGSPENVMPF